MRECNSSIFAHASVQIITDWENEIVSVAQLDNIFEATVCLFEEVRGNFAFCKRKHLKPQLGLPYAFVSV